MIDLHLHTTASDGTDAPADSIEQVVSAGVRVFAVTDHDTVAALPTVAGLAAVRGLTWIPGIEITAVEQERDVHVLGYGFDIAAPTLTRFLVEQRASRLARLNELAARFAHLGMPFDVRALVAQAEGHGGRSVGRAHVARELVAAGHVASVEEAFERWLSPGLPGFVPRRGASVAEVVTQIRVAGGIASLAHPGLIHDDAVVARVIGAGLHALEAHHSEHDAAATARYVNWAAREGLVVTGGSDFHGAAANRKRRIGEVSLPVAAYRQLQRRALREKCAAWPDTSL